MARVSLEGMSVVGDVRSQEDARSKIIRKVSDEVSRS